MFNLNKTKKWRDSLSKSDFATAMSKARDSKKQQIQIFLKRKQTLHNERANKLKSAREQKEKKARDLVALKERLTIEIETIGGLWVDETAIQAKLDEIITTKEKKAALKIQLDFRNKVLGSKCDRSLFFLSHQGQNRSVDELTSNLLKVIQWKEVDEQPNVSKDFSEAIFLPPDVVSCQKNKLLTSSSSKSSANKETSKKRPTKDKDANSSKAKKAKNASNCKRPFLSTESKIPVVSSPCDLVGKLVHYYCHRDGRDDWFRGLITKQVGGLSKNPKFQIQYFESDQEGNDSEIRNFFEDFKNGKLVLSEVKAYEFIDASIGVRYDDDDTGEETWRGAEVADIDIDSDQNNPVYYVYYTSNDFDENKPEYFLEPLMENYLNGLVRFLDSTIKCKT